MVVGWQREVVKGFVLDEWVEPSISNEHILEIDVVRAGDVLCVLIEDIGLKRFISR